MQAIIESSAPQLSISQKYSTINQSSNRTTDDTVVYLLHKSRGQVQYVMCVLPQISFDSIFFPLLSSIPCSLANTVIRMTTMSDLSNYMDVCSDKKFCFSPWERGKKVSKRDSGLGHLEKRVSNSMKK